MTRALEAEIVKLLAEIKDAEARLSAQTDFWAEKQRIYLDACEATGDPKVLSAAQIAAQVAYDLTLDAVAFKGAMIVKLKDLKAQRQDAIAKKTAARKTRRDDGREAA
ncbi:hypothetical protein CcrBL47_gp512 [Caulobacter phage BL47]|nr:hypothetical protein CcrBL47_gp512 [Caulobacter phage BL47]UTU10352.1 hypothetical protein CcrRB23_gp490 [Caulobacter phage RB23]